jgi:hypothetical protein
MRLIIILKSCFFNHNRFEIGRHVIGNFIPAYYAFSESMRGQLVHEDSACLCIVLTLCTSYICFSLKMILIACSKVC